MRGDEKPWMVVTIGASRQARERERQPVEVVVDQVELGRAAQGVGDVQRLPDTAVDLVVLLVGPLADSVERREA